MSSALRIVFEQDGYPRELINNDDVRSAIEGGDLSAATEVTVYRSGQAPEVVVASRIAELRHFFPGSAELVLDEPIVHDNEENEAVLELKPEPGDVKAEGFERLRPEGFRSSANAKPAADDRYEHIEAMAKRRNEFGRGASRAGGHYHGAVRPTGAGSRGFWYWALLPFSSYADLSGRAGRREYWSFTLFLAVVGIVFLAFGSTWFAILALVTAVPSLAVTVRRLHDMNYSGWFVLLALVPYIGLLVLVLMLMVPGSHGANRFGNSPE